MSTPDQTPDTDELERAAEQIEAPLAGLVGDYEESEADNAPQAKGIFLLPNLLTSGALFCGFYAIIAGMQGDFYAGAVAILVAMLFDGLDGRVARMTRTSSAFGAQYDSLSDMVSFGLAPALLTFNWALKDLGKVGWVAAFIYAACAALRWRGLTLTWKATTRRILQASPVLPRQPLQRDWYGWGKPTVGPGQPWTGCMHCC